MEILTEQSLLRSLDQAIGYLNFSSGTNDVRFLGEINQIFGHLIALQESESLNSTELAGNSEGRDKSQPVYQIFFRMLRDRVKFLGETSPTYRNCSQAESVISSTFEKVLPGYFAHHHDLLLHRSADELFNSLFVGRVLETVLQIQNEPGSPGNGIIKKTLQRINNYLGHRPIATLEGRQIEPYEHEKVAPIPIFIRDVGVAHGKYRLLVEKTIEILRASDPGILQEAQFDPANLDEIGIDPRSYDFDHPVNSRPNHHFGEWDDNAINQKGDYCRYIIYEVMLDSLLGRVNRDSAVPSVGSTEETNEPKGKKKKRKETDHNQSLSQSQLLHEASCVLAGTILMGSAISGSGPTAYDSNTNLHDLIPVVAGFRDQFYQQQLEQLPEEHKKRLKREEDSRKQPFGAARQDINSQLARLKANQLVNCRLASIYARMGYAEAAENQSRVVPIASARINCQIDCLLDLATRAVTQGNLELAYEAIPQIMDRLKRGIACGAIVDPWNILGFDANYSLFPAIENSVPDHRVFDLVDLMERIFAICSRLWSESAACDNSKMTQAIREEFHNIVQWWRQFAAHEVSSVDAVDADEVFAAAELVAEALNLWQKGGAAAGDLEFWSQHAELFDSPKAYALVIEALMQRLDYRTSMALLIHWLSQSDEVTLQMGDSSFYQLLFHWISEQRRLFFDSNGNKFPGPDVHGPENSPPEIWGRIRKFHDFMEANAEEYWQVPSFDFPTTSMLSSQGIIERPEAPDDDLSESDRFDSSDNTAEFEEPDSYPREDSRGENNDLFGAAYDEMVYRDTTNDGFQGEVFDGSLTSDDELELEVQRVHDRLEFLSSLASYWAVTATIPLPVVKASELNQDLIERLKNRRDLFQQWISQATANKKNLGELSTSINSRFPLPRGGSDYESMVRYDQLRSFKEMLMEQAILTSIETDGAIRMLMAVVMAIDVLLGDTEQGTKKSDTKKDKRTACKDPVEHEDPFIAIFAAVLLQQTEEVKNHCAALSDHLLSKTLLYVPITKGGAPEAIVETRSLQIALLDLMRHLPSLGLFTETYQLVHTTLMMERKNSVGNGAVTEFDELFEVAFTSMVHALIDATNEPKAKKLSKENADPETIDREAEELLLSCTEKLSEVMLSIWLEHSQTLRISVLERFRDSNSWSRLVEFIQTYGEGLFTQQFLHAGNIRGILHQGVEHWLEQVENSPEEIELKLLNDLDHQLPRAKAIRYLTLVLEAVLENYNEYRDYNSTTTQSDHGDCLFMFLDFLRLRSRYDRICWHLKPVMWAHSIFVNDQELSIARRWRRTFTERLSLEADKFLKSLEKLRQKYSIRMESIGRRLEGRFVHQMQIDRLCSLVAPAMKDPRSVESQRKFEMLQQQTMMFIRSTNGVGVDLPAWLAALENEVDQFQLLQRLKDLDLEPPHPETADISIEWLQLQLLDLPGRPLFESEA